MLICRPSGPVDIAATEIGRDVVATGINVHSKASCLQASIDPRHFRLCLVCERVRRKGGDRHDLFLARWYQAQASRSSGGTARPSKADVNTTFVLDDCNASFLVDTSDVFKRLRSGASGRDTEGSLVVRGVTLKSRGGQDGRDAAMLAGAALHSDATEMPEEMILTDQEWIEVVQTIVSYLTLLPTLSTIDSVSRVAMSYKCNIVRYLSPSDICTSTTDSYALFCIATCLWLPSSLLYPFIHPRAISDWFSTQRDK